MRKRSKYRPKAVDKLAAHRAIFAQTPFTEAELTALLVPSRLSVEALRYGKGGPHDFDTLACIVNVTLIRCEEIGGRNEDALHICGDAVNALLKMSRRAKETGRFGFGIGEMDAIVQALDLHDQIVALSTPKQMAEALKQVLRRIENGNIQHDERKTT